MNHFLFGKETARSLQREKLKKILLKSDKDSRILENLKPFLENSRRVMIYQPLKEEPNLLDLKFYFENISFVYPQILSKERKELIYVDWESNYSPDSKGIDGFSPDSIDIFLLPALGYSEIGTRLGRGGGFFDRSLRDIDPRKLIGVSYRECFPISFSKEAHDIQVGTVVTESESFFMLDDFSSPDTI